MTNCNDMKFSIKRLTRSAIAVLLCFCLCFSCAMAAVAANGQRAVTTPEDAEWLVTTLLSGDASSLNGAVLLTEPMAKAIEGSGGFQGLKQSLAMLGGVTEIGKAYEYPVAGQKAFRVPCHFQAMPLDLMLATADGALAGLVTAEYTGSANHSEQDASVKNNGMRATDLAIPVPALNGELPGTLTLPEGDGPFPAVVLVHGSGPNDRDETVMAQKPFRDLAEGLAQRGIAVYRYDKRTLVYGARMADELQLTLADETIDDAVAAVQLLAQQKTIDPSRIFVLGHSLGATAIPAVDRALHEQPAQACGYILMAGSARPLPELIRSQYEFLYSLLPEISEAQQAEKDQLFSDLDRLDDLDSLRDDTLIAGAYVPYWRWLRDYDVLDAAAEIRVPCLVLQGEEDYQVTLEDYSLWQNALKNYRNWQFISYPGLTHTFVHGQKAEGSAVYTRNEQVDPQVIDDIARFIQAHLDPSNNK